MSNSKLLIFLVFSFLISFASSSHLNTNLTTTTHQCSPQQTLALLLFKQNLSSINDTSTYCQYPVMMNWNTSTDCCDWDGVTCDHSTGDVIGLDLSCGMLQGTIHPNTSLLDLPRLQTLNLALNDFTGSQLPSEIGRFSNTLTRLDISYSGFSGQVPSGITLLHKLVSLDLSSNYYDDFSLEPRIFINMLQNYTSLEQLSLQAVHISSVLPAHLNISSSSLKILKLGYTGLHGKLPHYIFNLQSLEKLSLCGNGFTGQIPWEISLLPKLVSLDLSRNGNLRMKPHIFNSLLQNSSLLRDLRLGDVNIGLVLPTYLNISSSLNFLDLSNTSLKGKLPDNIFNFQYLEALELSGNNLIGPLPRVNATIPLMALDLSSNNLLLGEIPDSIGHFNSLTFLALSDCSLTGPLPRSLFNLRQLTYLSLSYNNFSGDWELDTLLSSLTNLDTLDLSYSGLSIVTTNNANHHVNPNFRTLNLASCKIKVFPKSLRSMRNLQDLDLSSNEIHGHIPHWAGEIGGSTLDSLDLSHNFITGLPQFQWYGLIRLYLQSNLIRGPFPRSICNMSDLRYLDLSNNRFEGVIPKCFGNITSSLSMMYLSNNRFRGPFPPSICNMSSLMYLDLSNNNFDGVIPECYGNITSSLIMMNLGNNHFQGTIPNVYENCGGLQGLILNGNQFEGEVPSSLSKCQSLKVLDMGNNHLNGTFPSWLESLPDLQVLVLRSNSFHGRIVPSSTVRFPFQTLRVLDLSHNAFLGPLPAKFFQSFNAMNNVARMSTKPEYLSMGAGIYYSIIIVVKGQELLFPKLFVDYTIVDLSSNTFEGEIPNIIGTLNSLKALNLSHNNLIGQIPHTLGNLTDIESLDLSWNQLTGEIPHNLTDIKGLAVLNLSQNKLRGRIPQGTQFNTFNETSFGGNLGLCGFPLPKCEHGSSPQAEGDGDADEENGITWKAVMLGYGCGTLLGLVLGYLMLSTGKPKWFNAIADKGEHMIQIRRNKKRCVYIGK